MTQPILLITATSLLILFLLRKKLRRKTPQEEMEEMEEMLLDTTGLDKELLKGVFNNDSTVLKGPNVPGAQGPYGLSPDNPICCGSIALMEMMYSAIRHNGRPVRDYASVSYYSREGTLGIRSRRYSHTTESGIPDIYLTKEFHYPQCKSLAPDGKGFSIR